MGYFEDNLLIDFKDILNENEVKIKDIIYDYIGELYLYYNILYISGLWSEKFKNIVLTNTNNNKP